jgi:hypothetical protein
LGAGKTGLGMMPGHWHELLGIEGDMLPEPSGLVAGIEGLDSFSRAAAERIAGQAGVKPDALYAMAGILGKAVPNAPEDHEGLLREGAARLKEYQSGSVPSGLDPELDRLTMLAADAVAEGLFDRAAMINEQAKARAGEGPFVASA